ncbi:hypothetical protein ACFOQM_11520 [Paenibacillus sp. GCM10012307]|uniref:hypothetical protein n=1 Tax=Paenibacillus TaxID=44249 RepID=UPI001E5FC86A|nr:hypothetical protein [Paenibacillus roseus]
MSRIRLFAVISILLIGVVIGTVWNSEAIGSQVAPGTAEDPVVTKSYVDQLFKQNGGGSSSAGPDSVNTAMQVVTVPAGKTLVATQEGTEFIVRSGKALAFSEDKDGISNLTLGADLTNGKAVANNHLILSPRAGRGIVPDDKVKNNKLIVLVKGGYELK